MKILIVILCALLSSTSAFSMTLIDGQVTNGGDGYVAEFFLLLDSALSHMPATIPLENNATLQRSVLQQARNQVQISSEENLHLDGREVSAINQPFTNPPTIKLSRSFWKVLSENQKLQLVVHEIFPVAGVYDADYKNSTALIRIIAQTTPLSFSSLAAATSVCDTDTINAIPEEPFMRLTTDEQKKALLIESLNQSCAPLLRKYIAMNINMDICVGGISLMNWYLRQATGDERTFDILKLLMLGGAPVTQTCATRLNDSCKQIMTLKLPQPERFAEVLRCNNK
ncbi:hypothetical protein [Bdellovibrio sp. NC01]|uniref:hypothetical protein n=1 Tax=Bdellovibrio sp. NC01 TaxID=2220073 RepID=UPI00115B71DE|nr:hypothetical protein [Bdellovibrio sp. NC01]QDK38753.1 hypothetical protein DOE51_14740 [Bdellovibrio sp. NC01]